jgi:hypothetical protein
MKSVYIVVEGQSEEKFVKEVLTPYFARKNIFLYPEIVITGRNSKGKLCKGGGDSYQLYKNHLQRLIRQFSHTQNFYFTTMIDLYALSTDFPRFNESQKYSDKYELIAFLEKSFAEDICSNNFIPYIQLHEFETLLLHDIQKIGDEFFDTSINVNKFQEEIAGYSNLELVNNSKENAPSKRIDKYTHGHYCGRKVTSSFNILKNVNIDMLRGKYQHFNGWLGMLERIL